MKVILSVSDEGYSERIWWRLFWAYLMKVIPETRRAHYIWYHVLTNGEAESKLTSSYTIKFVCIHDMAIGDVSSLEWNPVWFKFQNSRLNRILTEQ